VHPRKPQQNYQISETLTHNIEIICLLQGVYKARDALQWLSITRDLQRKNILTKPKFWWMSIISASLPTVCKIYLKKKNKSETLQQSTCKTYHSTFGIYDLLTNYIGVKYSLKSINEDVCWVFNGHSHA